MATQEAMVNWAKNNLYRWIDMDGMYGAQCVDLTMAYTQYFGNYRMFGNAIDYLKNPLPKGWLVIRPWFLACSSFFLKLS